MQSHAQQHRELTIKFDKAVKELEKVTKNFQLANQRLWDIKLRAFPVEVVLTI